MAICAEAVLSNDYKGFAIASRRSEQSLAEVLRADCVRRVSENLVFAYFYYPSDTESGNEYPFSLMPNCYGLLSEQELAVSGTLALRESPYTNLYGQNVILGFVDTGINFAEDDFRNADGTTRLVGLWDQTLTREGNATNASPYAFYGTEFSRDAIDQALLTQAPYEVVASRDENGHGSEMVRAAAGSVTEYDRFGGVAPGASLAIVKLRQAKPYLRRFYNIRTEAECFEEDDIIYGIEWMLSVAEGLNLPIVIVICLGSNQGNHTGETILSRYLNEVSRFPGVCVVTAAGNEVGLGHHFYGEVLSEPYVGVELLVGEGEQGFSMELWALEPDLFTLEIASPAGEIIPRVEGSATFSRSFPFPIEGGRVDIQSNLYDRIFGLQGIFIRFSDVAPGLWRIRVYREGEFSGAFHMWLPMEQFISPTTRFLRPSPYVTICDPGTASEPITFTAYSVRSNALYLTASYGYTADNNIKPDLAAPQGEGSFVGTGKAAAFGAGSCALFFEDASRNDNLSGIGTPEIKRALVATATRERLTFPNREWGFGQLNVYRAVLSLRELI